MPAAGSVRLVTGSRIGRRSITSGSATVISRPRAAAGRGTGLSSSYPAPIVLVDATAGPDAVFEAIKSEVERVLALDPRP